MKENRAHIVGRTLATKALRTGYYWPTLRANAIEMVRKCDKCQRFALFTINHPPPNCIHSPLPFATWGMDILGPFLTVTG